MKAKLSGATDPDAANLLALADFLVRSSGRTQAESTARAYSEWYAAGSRERAYWIQVLATIRSRP